MLYAVFPVAAEIYEREIAAQSDCPATLRIHALLPCITARLLSLLTAHIRAAAAEQVADSAFGWQKAYYANPDDNERLLKSCKTTETGSIHKIVSAAGPPMVWTLLDASTEAAPPFITRSYILTRAASICDGSCTISEQCPKRKKCPCMPSELIFKKI